MKFGQMILIKLGEVLFPHEHLPLFSHYSFMSEYNHLSARKYDLLTFVSPRLINKGCELQEISEVKLALLNYWYSFLSTFVTKMIPILSKLRI